MLKGGGEPPEEVIVGLSCWLLESSVSDSGNRWTREGLATDDFSSGSAGDGKLDFQFNLTNSAGTANA